MTDTFERLKAALADRYAIEREVGRGGMATVYLARDLKHQRPVAIKVLDPDLTATIGADRFLREIDFAAKLTHPNILPLHDSGEVDRLLYYVMPYIEGESLRKRIIRGKLMREDGLPLEDALRITRGVAAALDHAHRHGVVHRDIKPDNILLADGDPVVADFGIARALNAAGGKALTRAGSPIGTPMYMSPEQAIGNTDLDARTDIYSLALVLYEMLVGEVPHTPAERRSIETDTPSGHRRRLAALPQSVTQALARAMAEDPAKRFETAGDFAAALTAASPRRGAFTKWTTIAAGVMLVTIVAIGAAMLRRIVVERSALIPNRVLITTFKNGTGDSSLAHLGAIVVDWLTRGLQETGVTQVIDVRVVATGDQDSREGTALAIARSVRAGMVVSGSYYVQGDSLQFHTVVTETETGTVLHSLDPVRGSLGAPLDAVELLRQRVAGAMAGLLDQNWPTAFMKPPSYEAYQEYVAAVPLVGRLDYAGAIGHFLRAAAFDSSFTLPLLYAAVLMTEGDMFGPADSLAREVSRSRGQLRSLERNLLEYLEARLSGELANALTAIQRVAEAAPLSEATFDVGQMLLRLNRPREAIDVFGGLDPTQGFLENWWFYWNHYAAGYHLLGDHAAELETARRGRVQHPEEIGVLAAEMYALAALGMVDELNGRLDEAEAMMPKLEGRAVPPMWQFTEMARELRAHRHDDASRAALDRVRSWDEGRTEDESTTVAHRAHMAMVSYLAERWDEAQQRFQLLSAEFPSDVNYRGYLGVLAARRDDAQAARGISDWLGNVDRPYLYGNNTVWRARIAALLGQPDEAVALLRSAFDEGLAFYGTSPFLWISRTDVAWLHREMDFESLRDHPEFAELLRPGG